MAATIYSYNSNNRYCTYTLSMARSGSTVTITASGSIYTKNTSGGDGSGSVYAQLRRNVSPAQTEDNPAKGSTAAKTKVTNYGTLLTQDGWSINVSVTHAGSTITNTTGLVMTKPVDSSSSPRNPYNFTIKWTKTTNDAVSLSNVALFFSKNQTSITVGTYASYAFIGTEGDLSAHYARYHTDSLSVGVGFTAVGAPTSVTTSMSLQKPGANVVISWSGATAGTSNSINGYQVYGGTSSNPTTLLATVSSTSTSSSYTYTIPSSATRGATYYFRVKTTGSAGSSYYSGYSSSQPTCKVNTLPTLSTCSADKSIIARNSTTSVNFTLTGAANDGTLSFRYSTSNSTSNTTAITSGTSLSIAAGTSNVTYYFWAYDGLEYSSVKSILLTRNTLPATPGVTTNVSIVKSSGDNVTFTLTGAGSGEIYQYATSANGAKQTITSGTSLKVTATTTYYFWIWDGLDFGSSASKTITKNSPPTYANAELSGGQSYTSGSLTEEQNKLYKLNQTASLVGQTSTGGTLHYQWYYQMSDLSGDAVTGNTSTWYTISGATSNSYSTDNNTFKVRGKIYRLMCRITDSLTDYKDVIFAWRIVAPTPTITMVGNTGSASSPGYVDDQSTSQSFKDTLIFRFNEDSSLNGALSSLSISSGQIETRDVIFNQTTRVYTVEFATSNIQKNTSYTISFTMNGRDGAPSATMSKTLKTAEDPSNLTLTQTSTNDFRPFSGGVNYYNFELNNINNQLNYKLNSGDAITAITLKYGNNSKTITEFNQSIGSSTANYITLGFTADKVLDTNFIPESNWNTNQTITISSITMNDIFNFSHTINFSSNNSIPVIFQEGIILNGTSINSVNEQTNSGTYYDIYEGENNINISLTCRAYNTNKTVTAQLFIYRGNENTDISKILDSSWISYPTSGSSKTFTTGTNRENYIASTTTTISYNVDPVTESKYIYFRLGLTLNGNTKYIIYNNSTTKHVSVKQITPNNITLVDNSGNSKINLSLQISTANSGVYPIPNEAGITYALGLQFCDEPTFTTDVKYLNIEDGIGNLITTETFLYNASTAPSLPYNINFKTKDNDTEVIGEGFDNWERYYVRVIYITTNKSNKSYTGSNNTILTLYNLIPTIAYRKNRLGINTRYVDGVIGQTYDQGDIVIGAMNNDSYLYIVQGDDRPHASINLTTGELKGFVFDGGDNWGQN